MKYVDDKDNNNTKIMKTLIKQLSRVSRFWMVGIIEDVGYNVVLNSVPDPEGVHWTFHPPPPPQPPVFKNPMKMK